MYPTIQSPKISKQFICETCHYNCCKQSEFNKHIYTNKHKNLQNPTLNSPKVFLCECGKKYKHSSTLYAHKHKCLVILGIDNHSSNTNTTTQKYGNDTSGFQLDKELLVKMLLKNQDVLEKIANIMPKMMEIMPQMGNNSHNTNNNSHNTTNNQFNIQMFLNDHCKNAMNLTDFIDTLPITAATYDSTIENGLTKTITNMITNGLSKLDILERPIHCTDATRKTLYVKESNVWEKDTELLKVVAGITNLIRKKRTLISRWKESNRGWDTVERKQIKFTELVCNIMTDIEYDEKETGKIVRSISKTVYLDNEEKKKYIC